MNTQEKILIAIVIPGSVLPPLLFLFTPWLAFADYQLPLLIHVGGFVMMLTALWLFWRAHADLGQNWSITLELRKGHELVTNGVYRCIRHPMYAAIWLWSIAQGLLLNNWLAGWSAVVTFAPMYFLRTPHEERMLCGFFGQKYRECMQQTGRLCPRINFRQ